jgi:hypothetical protein
MLTMTVRVVGTHLFVKTSAKRENRGSGGIAPSGVQGQSPGHRFGLCNVVLLDFECCYMILFLKN